MNLFYFLWHFFCILGVAYGHFGSFIDYLFSLKKYCLQNKNDFVPRADWFWTCNAEKVLVNLKRKLLAYDFLLS